MLVEYFLRVGYYNTAIKLARHSGIEVRSIPHFWGVGNLPRIYATDIKYWLLAGEIKLGSLTIRHLICLLKLYTFA